ncbi:MAG: sporulation peptidase YabG [Firmicutes bacterium]|nr:sporulation peptidase YabG [Bacillota bacterium]
MIKFQVGDYVKRTSYGGDIVFVIDKIDFRQGLAILKGVNYRLLADSPLTDLVKDDFYSMTRATGAISFEPYKSLLRSIFHERLSNDTRVQKTTNVYRLTPVPGKVLHIDGEEHYLKQSLELYHQLNVPVVGVSIHEIEQASKIQELLEKYMPDILVITGHDGLLRKYSSKDNIANYRSSIYYRDAVRKARKYEPDKDSLVIIAGACQSYFEILMEAGANFASSPNRKMIHCFDPVLIAERIAYTSFNEIVDLKNILSNTMSGLDGYGGLQTKGKLRYSFPDIY